MSFYNILFGENPFSDIVLATLGLTRHDVGRFRDVYLENDEIVVLTRNGGNNRSCWCEEDPLYGYPLCKHELVTEIVPETIWVPRDEVEKYPEKISWFSTVDGKPVQLVKTGKMVPQKYYKCLHPNSADCGCPGCIITYRLPQHPNYLRDEDDDFDSTYAYVYFSFPEKYAGLLKAMQDGKDLTPFAELAKGLVQKAAELQQHYLQLTQE